MENNGFFIGRQTGMLQMPPPAQLKVERKVAYLLGIMGRDFQSGTLQDEDVENADETNLFINVDSGKLLSFRGDQEMEYTDVTSGGEGMKILVRIYGGKG